MWDSACEARQKEYEDGIKKIVRENNKEMAMAILITEGHVTTENSAEFVYNNYKTKIRLEDEQKRLRQIIKENDQMSEAVEEILKEGIAVSRSEARRYYMQLKDKV